MSGPARRRRGSVLILVVAVLAVLVLFSVTLSYITKVDLLAARNWADTVQGRMAVLGSLPFKVDRAPLAAATNRAQARLTSGSLERDGGSAARLAPLVIGLSPDAARLAAEGSAVAAEGSVLAADRVATAAGSSGATGVAGAVVTDALATTYFEDESAKIDVNAVVPGPEPAAGAATGTNAGIDPSQMMPGALSEDGLARFITAALEARRVTGVDAARLAHAIAAWRLGADGRAEPTDRQLAMLQSLRSASGATAPARSAPAASGLVTAVSNVLSFGGMAGPGASARQWPTAAAARLAADTGWQVADPRLEPRGDDQPYALLGDLMNVPGMTPAAYHALAPYLTTFSVSFDAFALPGTGATGAAPEGFPQVDPNTASAAELFQVLQQRFPNAPESLLGQFVANIIDRRDADDVPTAVRVGDHVYYGLELNPCINEVCPDVSSDDSQGDDGQYIELCNPYAQKTFALTGWTVRVQNRATLQLTGTLPPGGYLVLTDDFNSQNDRTHQLEPGTGSFFQIFHKVANPPKYMIREYPAMDLPDDTGLVQLVNPDGNVVDEFAYKGGRWNGANTSLQRIDPRLRYYEKAAATPLAPNAHQNLSESDQLALRLQEEWQNTPFRSPLDVMLVSAAYVQPADSLPDAPAGPRSGTAANAVDLSSLARPSTAPASEHDVLGGLTDKASSFAMPRLSAAANTTTSASAAATTGAENTALDVRLVDCFCLGAWRGDDRATSATGANTPWAGGATPGTVGRGWAVATREAAQVRPPDCATGFGRLNLNTAPLATLAALPGMDRALLARVDRARRQSWDPTAPTHPALRTPTPQDPTWWTPGNPFDPPRWANLSDFLLDDAVWEGRELYDRLDAVAPFSRLVTTHSMALRAISENQVGAPAAGASATRRPTLIRTVRQLAGDRGALETVTFRYLRDSSDLRPDIDLRAAAPASGQGLNYTARVLETARQFRQYVARAARHPNPALAER